MRLGNKNIKAAWEFENNINDGTGAYNLTAYNSISYGAGGIGQAITLVKSTTAQPYLYRAATLFSDHTQRVIIAHFKQRSLITDNNQPHRFFWIQNSAGTLQPIGIMVRQADFMFYTYSNPTFLDATTALTWDVNKWYRTASWWDGAKMYNWVWDIAANITYTAERTTATFYQPDANTPLRIGRGNASSNEICDMDISQIIIAKYTGLTDVKRMLYAGRPPVKAV